MVLDKLNQTFNISFETNRQEYDKRTDLISWGDERVTQSHESLWTSFSFHTH